MEKITALLAITCLLITPVAQAKRDITIIAHRGNPERFPENTLPGIESGAKIADAIKLDVRETKDGALVIIHDDTVNRTTNGVGAVAEMTLEEIKRLDAGIKGGKSHAGLRVPTLEEALEVIPEKTLIIIERKAGSLDAFMRFFEQRKLIGKAYLEAEDWDFLKEAKRRQPKMLTLVAAILEPWGREVADRATAIGASGVILRWNYFPDGSMAGAQKRKLKIFLFMVNDLVLARRLALSGVTGIFTDKPEEFMRTKEFLFAR